MEIEKVPEWDYVTHMVQHEGTDGMKQGLHFLQVPGRGLAKCNVQLRTIGWPLMRMRRGRRRGVSRKTGPAVMGRVGLHAKRRT
eukprot:1151075-Pelagomonas_calceolata.AAC.4